MKGNRFTYFKNMLLPCLGLSCAAGVGTGVLIFLFQAAATGVIGLSGRIYSFVRANPIWFPLMLAGALILGFVAACVLRRVPDCRGGGIPTAIAGVRGVISFRWLRSIVFVFFSSMLSYLCGVPLGNEGPSVQMGTAVGRGTVRIFSRKNPAWDRCVMTGGAGAGFAAATGSPLAALLFIFEEVHRRFFPMLFLMAASTILFSSVTTQLLCDAVGISSRLFDFSVDVVLPVQTYWAPLVVGLVCGLFAVIFTTVYDGVWDGLKKIVRKIPFHVLVISIFAVVCVVGFFLPDCLGSGHDLIHNLTEGHAGAWYLLLGVLLIRVILLIFANCIGVTGGLFVPSLAFGAILGFLCSRALTALGLLGAEYDIVLTVIGMAAFLGASSRIPLTGIAFAVEALCGLSNLIPVALGVTLAYLVIEAIGIDGFNETVIESKVEVERHGKTPQTVETDLVVQPGAFVEGREVRNVLWPPSCVILSVYRNPDRKSRHFGGMEAGDILHVHYTTYDNAETVERLEHLVGKQPKQEE